MSQTHDATTTVVGAVGVTAVFAAVLLAATFPTATAALVAGGLSVPVVRRLSRAVDSARVAERSRHADAAA